MAIQTITATSITLISIIDLRPIDFQSGKRLAIPAEACNVCDRCGKLHVKVYEVVADEQTYHVGSGCCKRLFGWEPTKMAVEEKERKAEQRAMQKALEVAAQQFLDSVNALPVPEPKCKGVQKVLSGWITVWHADGVLLASDLNCHHLSAKKIAEFAQCWRNAQQERMLKAYAATYQASRSESKRAKQLIQAVKKMSAE